MNATLITNVNIKQLRTEAAEADDTAQVELCDRALEGDEDARTECERVILDARTECDEDEDEDECKIAEVFGGDETQQVDYLGRRAFKGHYYYEPKGYESDVLWSNPYASREEAEQAARNAGYEV